MHRPPVLAVLFAAAAISGAPSTCDAFAQAWCPRSGAGVALREWAAKPSRPPRRRPRAAASCGAAANLPLEITGCKIFNPDGSFDRREADAFLRDYWQRQPVLLRQAFPFESPISPDELAGLSLEEEVASRLIINWGSLGSDSRPPQAKDYELRVGPFTEETFAQELPETCYTLLCNNVTPLIPQLSALEARFSFIPNWRLDDIMISYAPEGGGVGPHVDNYDVFLLQGLGTRKWSVSTRPIAPQDEKLIEDIDVSVLKGDFPVDAEWVLNPGDVLYVPPRIPHWGVSLDEEYMTYSIGFRAPTLQDLASEYANHMCDNKDPDLFYTDPPQLTSQPADPGRIHDAAVARMWAEVGETILGTPLDSTPPLHFQKWLGGYLTQPLRRPSGEPLLRSCDPEEAARILEDIDRGVEEGLNRNEAAKVAWLPLGSQGVALFADGRAWEVQGSTVLTASQLEEAAAAICGSHTLSAQTLKPLLSSSLPWRSIIEEWVREGILYCDDEEEDEEEIVFLLDEDAGRS